MISGRGWCGSSLFFRTSRSPHIVCRTWKQRHDRHTTEASLGWRGCLPAASSRASRTRVTGAGHLAHSNCQLRQPRAIRTDGAVHPLAAVQRLSPLRMAAVWQLSRSAYPCEGPSGNGLRGSSRWRFREIMPVGSPVTDFYGGHRLGDNLFANSLREHPALELVRWDEPLQLFGPVDHDVQLRWCSSRFVSKHQKALAAGSDIVVTVVGRHTPVVTVEQ